MKEQILAFMDSLHKSPEWQHLSKEDFSQKFLGKVIKAQSLYKEYHQSSFSREKIVDIFLKSFNKNELNMICYYAYGIDIENIVDSRPLPSQIQALVDHAIKTKSTKLLLQKAIKVNPHRSDLKDLEKSV